MPDATPLVSVVMPVHNGQRFLAAAIDSVLGQDYQPVEVIVVDDGSTDGSAAIARARPVRLIEQPNGGVSAARNAGLAAARGELIAFLDQDDLFTPDKLTRQVAVLQREPELAFVAGRLQIELEPGSPVPPWWNPDWDPDGEKSIQLGAFLMRRRAFDAVGGFDERYAIAGDADWVARAKDAGLRWRMLPDVVMTYRVHEDNNVHDQARMRAEVLRVMRDSVHRMRTRETVHEKTTVSVVIPVHNGAAYLAEAIESALAQTRPPAEVIVVDDGSTDGSAAVAARFAPRVRCVRRPACGGAGPARNDGAALASGDYLAFLDADDIWPAQRLDHLLAGFAARPGPDIVFGHVQEFRDPEAPDAPRPALLSSTALIARSAWDRVGAFGEDWAVGEFLDWLLRAREAGIREATVADTVLLRRLHDDNLTSRNRGSFGVYAQVLKASLDRRRRVAGTPPPQEAAP